MMMMISFLIMRRTRWENIDNESKFCVTDYVISSIG